MTSFGFGAANTAGTALSGNALATLNDQSMMADGNFTIVAVGSATNSTLFAFDNKYSSSVPANQAAVRFVNLATATGPQPFTFNVFTGATQIATGIAVGSPTPFRTVSSGPNEFAFIVGQHVAISGSAATLDLQAGTVNTVAIVVRPSGGLQLINIPHC